LLLGRLLYDEYSLVSVDIDEEDLMDRHACAFFSDVLISFEECSLCGASSSTTPIFSTSNSLFDLEVGDFVSDLLERLASESLRVDLSSWLA
jgi:hypothetical protein